MKTISRLGTAALALTLLASCAGTSETASDAARIVVSSYPLEYLATEIAGDLMQVENVVPSGAEPHDIELSPSDVAMMERAGLTIVVSGFQPAVDRAAAEISDVLDLAPILDLEERHGAVDPHFWLDPTRMISAATQIEGALAQVDPDSADDFAANSAALIEELETLDADFSGALAQCTFDSFVTGHSAFGYLADAYGLREVSIAGVDPETEPSPAALAATREEIRSLGLPAVFAEPGDTKVADVLAEELGISSGILDPIEAVKEGEDYLSLMRANLEALQGGLECR